MLVPKVDKVRVEFLESRRMDLLQGDGVDIDVLIWYAGPVLSREHVLLRNRPDVAHERAEVDERLQVLFAFFLRTKINSVDNKQRLQCF